MLNKYIVIFITVLTFSSCASKKNLPTNKPVENSNTVSNTNNYLINNLDFRTFNGRAKAKVEFGDQKHDATIHVRVKRDEMIWMSVTATIFNYEAARVLITPDSIKILNKLNSEYIVKPFSYIYTYTGPGVTFQMLQDVFLANVSNNLLRTDRLTVASADNDVQLVGIKDDLSFQYALNKDYRPKVFRLNMVGFSEVLEAFYGSFNQVTGYNFPQNQRINLSAKSVKVNAVLDYNKIEFNQEIEVPFSVPSKYKVIR